MPGRADNEAITSVIFTDHSPDQGYTNMTGLDISNKMVHLARAKNLYTRVMQVMN